VWRDEQDGGRNRESEKRREIISKQTFVSWSTPPSETMLAIGPFTKRK
jgi:hypothetical protein